jgi:diguanylate cyclase (GGDEF)-like protein
VGHTARENLNSPYYDQLKHGFAGLRFSDFVEEEFLSQYAQTSVLRSQLLLIMAIGATLISTGIEVSGQGGHPAVLIFNILVMLPVLSAALLVSTNPASHRLCRLLLAFSALLIGMLTTSIAMRASLDGMPYYFSILVTWMFVVWFILGLPFRHAAITALTITGLYVSGVILWDFRFNEFVFTTTLLFFINVVGAIGCYQFEYAKRRSFLDSRVLSQLAERDGLTGLYNRRSYDQYVERIWRQSRRENVQLTLILIDIDHFKAYNDHYGHQAGDDALKEVANVISLSAQRPLDFAARYGGEEFSLILYGPDDEYGREQPEQLRESVRDLKILHADSVTDQYLTVSIGVALVMPGSARSLIGAIQMADEALYQAKEAGRNRVIVKESDSHIQTGRFRSGKTAIG